MMKAEKLFIAYSTDNRGVEMMLVSIFSMMKYLPPDEYDVRVFVIESGLSRESKKKISYLVKRFANLNIEHLEVDDEKFKKFSLPRSQYWISQQAYYRYLLPDLLPGINKVLYIDIDTLCRGNIGALFNANVSAHYLAAVPSYFIDNKTGGFKGYKKAIGMTDSETYINSGVLVMNLEKMRKDKKVQEFLFNAGENRGKIVNKENDIFVDQTVANITFRGGIKILPYKWNALIHNHEHTHTPSPILLHFAGLHKPFYYADSHPRVVAYMNEYTDTYVECMSVVNPYSPASENNQMIAKKLKDLFDQVAQKDKHIHELNNEKDAMLYSTSWKMTSLLRRVAGMLRSLR